MIFISYSRKDAAFAQKLTRVLEDLHIEVWIDREDIPAGIKWSTAIQQGLSMADIMLVILSPDAAASHNVEDEWQYYLDRGKTVIPILLRPTDIHFQLSRIQYVDFFNQPFEPAFAQLQIELKRKGVVFPTPESLSTPPEAPAKTPNKGVYSHNAMPPMPKPAHKKSALRPTWIAGGVAAVIVLIAVSLIASNILNPAKAGEVTLTAVALNTPLPLIITATQLPTLIPSKTPEPTNTPVPTNTAVPTNTPFPTMTPIPQPAPDQAVRDYYQNINNRDYTATWNTLSDDYKRTRNTDANGNLDYGAYTKWWDSVNYVQIGEISIIDQTSDTAIVYAALTYVLYDGRAIDDVTPYFHMVYDQNLNKWLILDKTSS